MMARIYRNNETPMPTLGPLNTLLTSDWALAAKLGDTVASLADVDIYISTHGLDYDASYILVSDDYMYGHIYRRDGRNWSNYGYIKGFA